MRLATIPPEAGFLDTLSQWWLERGGGPNALFLLPTRRAARGLEEAFLRRSDGRPMLLPRIAALGAADETPLALSGVLALPPAVGEAQRLAVLSRMILALRGEYGAPATADGAWVLAAELAGLLDEAARAEIDVAEKLPGAVAEEMAGHWQVTLQFLAIVTRQWPDWLREEGLADIAQRQIALLAALARHWGENPPAYPVIAAGSTGAIPAVARLLRTISRLPQGQVVLPGLDLALDEASWAALDETHPQAGLRALLAEIGARRGDVEAWGGGESLRTALLRQALLPAKSLPSWLEAPPPLEAGMAVLECRDQQEEAVAAALVLREAIETPGARAALITPDRVLARRVAAELLRFGVVADDSAGESLAETPPAVLLRVLARAVADNLAPVALLSLLKHPLCAAGLAPAQCRAEARRLELRALRGAMQGPNPEALRDPDAPAFLARLGQCLGALLDATTAAAMAPDSWLRLLIVAAEALAASDAEAGAVRLWAGEEGAALAERLAELLPAFAVLPPQPSGTLPGLLEASLSGIAVRSRRALRGRDGFEHPRVFIWGLLEARLQSVEVAVLGGLSEGVWPPASDPGPWLNRIMRQAVGLPSPEEAVGRAAHDFVSACCGAGAAVLAAPARRDRVPAVRSRWLTRLEARLRGAGRALPAHPAAHWAALLDQPAGQPLPAPPPEPSPPVSVRPRRLRVTDIETWLRDPYSIYARHVLHLRPLDPLAPEAGAAEYGTIVHAGLAAFVRRHGAAWPDDAAAALCRAMDAALEDAGMSRAMASWWRPRLHRIAAWVAEAERARRAVRPPAAIAAEIQGEWGFAAPGGWFALIGRADRIERDAAGRLAVLDYKSGALPAKKAVEESGLSPQLPLEAAMLEAGAFGADWQGAAAELTYWKLSGGREPGEVCALFGGDAGKVGEAAATAAARLRELVAAYDDPGRAYLSLPHPGAAPRFGQYTRLARFAEWGQSPEADDGGPTTGD